MFVFCKKDIANIDNNKNILYSAGKTYEAKIVMGDDLLAKDNYGEFGLIAISPNERNEIGLDDGISHWGKWFDEHFDIII